MRHHRPEREVDPHAGRTRLLRQRHRVVAQHLALGRVHEQGRKAEEIGFDRRDARVAGIGAEGDPLETGGTAGVVGGVTAGTLAGAGSRPAAPPGLTEMLGSFFPAVLSVPVPVAFLVPSPDGVNADLVSLSPAGM